MSRTIIIATLLVAATIGANGHDLASSHLLRKKALSTTPLKKLPSAVRWDSGPVHTTGAMGNGASVWAMVDTLGGCAAAQDTVYDYPSLSYSEIAVCASNPQSTQFDFRAAAKDLIDRKNGLVARNGTFDPEFDGTNEQAVRAQCSKEHVAAARLERIEEITNDRVKLMEHIAYRGPVFVGINAVPLQTYQGGILRCPAASTTTDAYMVVVGYDHSDHMNGNGFWIVKAAWGANWGENGHARVSMEDGACGIGKIGFSAHMMRLAGTKLH